MLEQVAESSSLYASGIAFALSLGFCALFSFLETSITAMRLYKLKEIAQSTNRYESLLASLEQNQNRVLTTMLIANNLANVIAATTGTWLTERLFKDFPESVSVSAGILLTTAAILIIGEVIPKNIAKALGERLFTSTLWITNITYRLLYPIVTLFLYLSNYMIKKIGGPAHEEETVTSEKEIRFLIDYIDQKGLIEKEKTAMLRSVFELGTTSVRDIVVPAHAIVSIEVRASLADALQLFKQHQYSRLPVYETSNDNVIGILHLKDLLTVTLNETPKQIKDILRPILFIPASIKVSQLLKEFKEQQMHLALAIDEHGTILGLVTLEDVLEEIVGEIKDEYETAIPKIIPLKEGSWVADASIELKMLHEQLGVLLTAERALTLSGFLAEQLQRLPRKGDEFVQQGYRFHVQQATPRRALQVLIVATGQRKPAALTNQAPS